MKNLFLFFFVLASAFLTAQTNEGLVALYNFDNDTCYASDALGNSANDGIFLGTSLLPTCESCGVLGKGVAFNGVNDNFVIGSAAILDILTSQDFTLSFYFKSVPNLNPTSKLDILSRRENCSSANAFAVEYSPATNYLEVLFQESNTSTGGVSAHLSDNSCWHHIVVVREGTTTYLYENGLELDKRVASERIDIQSNEPLYIGKNSCDQTNSPFEGYFDEFRIYDRALSAKEVRGLYYAPDRIVNGGYFDNVKSETIYLGNSLDISINRNCDNITTYQWYPTDGVSDPSAAEPTLSPTETTTYHVNIGDSYCTAKDELRVTVIDPSALDCEDIYLPSAFTPNDDSLNDTYGFSLSIAIEELLSFEIFDRWGSRVFFTKNPADKWDGTFKGKELNPGVYLYKVHYKCNGEDKIKAGSVTLIR